jgi:hypothetical protein
MKLFLSNIILLCLFSCLDNEPQKISKPIKELTYNEALYLIQDLKQFELKNNKEFYTTLSKASEKYYQDITDEFLNKEYSMSGSFSEMNIIKNKMTETSHGRFTLAKKSADIFLNDLMLTKSNVIKDLVYSNDSISEIGENKIIDFSQTNNDLNILIDELNEARFLIWEAKINNYFSSLSYARFIKERTDNHSTNLNKQRKEELEDVFNFIKEDSLSINKVSLDVFEASKESINLSLIKANESIKENLKDLVYTSAEVASTIGTVGTSAIIIGSVEGVGVGETVYDFFIPTEDETRKILIDEYSNFLEKNKINFTQLLNKNTEAYYTSLLELIEKRENGKIRY